MIVQLRRRGAFTLIEFMIVVGIIAIVVAMALPSLLSSRKAANEAAAVSYLRSIHSGQTMCRLRFGTYADSDEAP